MSLVQYTDGYIYSLYTSMSILEILVLERGISLKDYTLYPDRITEKTDDIVHNYNYTGGS